MTTITKRAKARKAISRRKKTAQPLVVSAKLPKGKRRDIDIALIDFSPKNYRKIFNPNEITELAESLARYGPLHEVTVRPMPTGRYELVIGERRLRAAHEAKLKELPTRVRELTDEQADEIRLAENLKRVNPHPLEEAQLIAGMQREGKNIDDIALRIGKSKTFVYSRIKLSGLIEAIQEIFIVNKITIQEAFDIATLAPEMQQELFDQYLSGWQDKERLNANISHAVSRFKCDLNRAPFDTGDETLILNAGACGNCPFNSATLTSLFPELAKEARCHNRGCYSQKCQAQAAKEITQIVTGLKIEAVLIEGRIADDLSVVIDSLPETSGLPQHFASEVFVYEAPTAPDKEDFENAYDDEESDFDEEGYQAAISEYEAELTEYKLQCAAGSYKVGLMVNGRKGAIVLFDPERKTENYGTPGKITAKEVQQAIKEGKATEELLQQEIERLKEREGSAKERDKIKVQERVHETFLSDQGEGKRPKLTATDKVAAKLLIYQSLDYGVRGKVKKVLFPDLGEWSEPAPEELLAALAEMPEKDHAFLIRMALAGKPESKHPGNVTSLCLYRVAEAAATDVKTIEQEQQAKADERQKRLDERIAIVEKQIAKLKM